MSNVFGEADYNPFAMTGDYEQPQGDVEQTQVNYPETQEINKSPYSESAPQTTPTTLSDGKPVLRDGITGATITEEDIRKREEVLAKREEAIANRERQIEDARANGTLDQLNPHPRNFPIILKMYKYYPEEEIPEDALQLVSYVKWITYIGGLILALNAILSFFQLLPGPNSVDSTSISACIVFAVVYLVVMYPLSLELMFIPLYNSLKEGKGMKFVGFLIMFFIYAAFFIYMAIGLGDWGSLGFIRAITLLSAETNKWVGGISLLFAILSTLFSVFCGYVFYLSVKYFKNTDISKKAVGEAASAAANFANDHKEEIAKAAAENPELAMNAAQALQA